MDRRLFLAGTALAALGTQRLVRAEPTLFVGGDAGAFAVGDGGRPILAYLHKPVSGPAGSAPLMTRSGYIHPVHAPNGAMVTDDFNPDHAHQRGVWFAWTRTRLPDGTEPDFWNIGSGKGRIRSEKVQARNRTGEPVRLTANHAWDARLGEQWKRVLEETWELTLQPPRFKDPQAPDAAYVIDLTSRQRPLVDLELPQYLYGGCAVRGSREWPKGSAMKVLTSEGKDRTGADGSAARWVDMSGPVGDKTAGIALLEHPSVTGAPNLVRMHPDMPYYVISPPKRQRLVLDAGREHVFRYRIVAHNGPADPKHLDALWREFAA